MLSLKSKRSCFSKALLGTSFAMIALAARPALAQDKNPVQVNVGIAAAKPGDPIDIPLTLSGGENTTAGKNNGA